MPTLHQMIDGGDGGDDDCDDYDDDGHDDYDGGVYDDGDVCDCDDCDGDDQDLIQNFKPACTQLCQLGGFIFFLNIGTSDPPNELT